MYVNFSLELVIPDQRSSQGLKSIPFSQIQTFSFLPSLLNGKGKAVKIPAEDLFLTGLRGILCLLVKKKYVRAN